MRGWILTSIWENTKKVYAVRNEASMCFFCLFVFPLNIILHSSDRRIKKILKHVPLLNFMCCISFQKIIHWPVVAEGALHWKTCLFSLFLQHRICGREKSWSFQCNLLKKRKTKTNNWNRISKKHSLRPHKPICTLFWLTV